MNELVPINGVAFPSSESNTDNHQSVEPQEVTEETVSQPKVIETPPVPTIESITPELAEQYLATQKINRAPTNYRVKDYADRMKRGEWHISQPIMFSEDGDLFDGQHRLMAVIESGVTCDFLVLRGLPSETRLYVDIGQTRKVYQIAEIMGLGGSLNTKLATTKAMFIGQSLKPKNKSAEKEALGLAKIGATRTTFSPNKLIDLYVNHKEAIDFADRLKNPATASVKAVVARAYYSQNHDRLNEFIEVVNTGFVVTAYDEAAVALRNALITMKAEKRVSGANYMKVVYKKTISALSNFMDNKNVRFVKEKETELYPLPNFD
jgi:hypothetical protein